MQWEPLKGSQQKNLIRLKIVKAHFQCGVVNGLGIGTNNQEEPQGYQLGGNFSVWVRDDDDGARAMVKKQANDFDSRLTGLRDGLYVKKEENGRIKNDPTILISIFWWMIVGVY